MSYKVVATLVLFFAHIASAFASPYRIETKKGPFFLCDKRVVEDRWLVERFVVPLKKHSSNPLVIKDQDWEGSGPLMDGSVLYDPSDSKYKMWYGVWNSHKYVNKLPFSYNICYAESNDGIEWKKPALGVFEHEADSRNNFIRLGTDKTQAIDVCLNPRPDRFSGKFLAIHNQKGGVFVSFSDDGKAFTFLQDDPAISYHSDTHNNFVYDESRNRWLLFCRSRAYAGDHKRRVSMQESSDLKTWTHERTILIPTEIEKQEFYGMPVFRRGDLFWGVLQVYDRSTGFMHGELTWSSDGKDWSQIPTHPAFLERGPEKSWDHGMVMAADEPIISGDEMQFYYGGAVANHHKTNNVHAIGLATAQRDRLVGLCPVSDEPGYVLTRPLMAPKQKNLNVNVVIVGSGGMLRAELRDDDNRVIRGYSLEDCDPVTATGYAQRVTWQGQAINTAPIMDIRIRFEITSAQFFSFNIME